MNDYKKTLNLPDTTFPMKASLTQNEPKILEKWRETDAYSAMVHASENGEPYTLHDGPPYANGHIHIGHAMNKILKDIIVKHRNITGKPWPVRRAPARLRTRTAAPWRTGPEASSYGSGTNGSDRKSVV